MEYLTKTVFSLFASFKETVKRKMPMSFEMATVLAMYIFAVGVLDWFVQRFFLHQAAENYLQWTIGFRPDGPGYNTSFISYLIGVVGLLGGVFGAQLLNYLPALKRLCLSINEKMWGIVGGLAAFLAFVAPFQLSTACFFVAMLIFALRVYVQGLPRFENDVAKPIQRTLLYLVLVGLIGFSIIIGAKAWYPVVLTNDYIELSDKVIVPAAANEPAVSLNHGAAINCLTLQETNLSEDLTGDAQMIKNSKKELLGNPVEQFRTLSKALAHLSALQAAKDKHITPCEHPLTQRQSDLLYIPLQQSGNWQSQAGRTLYHHSYLYVPIAHLITYGLSSPIPYLYGLGNTWFHAQLMKDKPLSLSTYFNTFPIAQLTGIMVIVLCVSFMAGNIWAFPAACAATLIPLFAMGYESLLLAPGFSPMRYAGLALQLASIAYLYRGTSPLRIIGIFIALVASLVWNKEYAVLGFVGQTLALMMSQLRIGVWLRFTMIALCCVLVALVLAKLGTLSHGFLETIQVGIFGIAMPSVDNAAFLGLCAYVVMVAAVLVVAALRFDASERAARLCIIPVLGLLMIKYVYNLSPVHLLYTLAFIFPASLIFLDWNSGAKGWVAKTFTVGQRKRFTTFMLSILMVVCVAAALHYQRDSYQRRAMLVDVFQKNSWTDLGETIQTTTPAEPIVSRMKAIQEQIKPEDSALFLSPFDHLMSFYGNPKSFCGHFEYLTNLVTYDNIAFVEECVRSNPNVLVVYDDAIETKCPSEWDDVYYSVNSCTSRKKLLLTMQTIMAHLKPELTLVKKSGSLSFYRRTTDYKGSIHKSKILQQAVDNPSQ